MSETNENLETTVEEIEEVVGEAIEDLTAAPAVEIEQAEAEQAEDEPQEVQGEEVVSEEDEEEESEDSLTFSNGVIEKIVAIAMRDVPGVVGMKGGLLNRIQDAFGATDARKGVSVEVTPNSSVRVSVSVLIEYGSYAPQVFEDVKRAIVGQVTGMTGLQVAGVNLRIEDVLTPEEVAERRAAEGLLATETTAKPAEAGEE